MLGTSREEIRRPTRYTFVLTLCMDLHGPYADTL
jgi:hypothetical protein